MLFSKHPRTVYANAPTHEVICQFRFPVILAINDTEPTAFQDAIREDFPQFIRREDVAPPRWRVSAARTRRSSSKSR